MKYKTPQYKRIEQDLNEKIASGHRSRTSTITGTWNRLATRIPAMLVSGWALDPMIRSGFPYCLAYFFEMRSSPKKNDSMLKTREIPFPRYLLVLTNTKGTPSSSVRR